MENLPVQITNLLNDPDLLLADVEEVGQLTHTALMASRAVPVRYGVVQPDGILDQRVADRLSGLVRRKFSETLDESLRIKASRISDSIADDSPRLDAARHLCQQDL